ncbi:MAG: hypothetical protein ACLGSA_08725 [Acidobacteriota bacterium]
MRRLHILLPLLAALLACPAFAAMQAEPLDFKGIPFAKEFEPDGSFVCQLDSEEGLRCIRPSDDLHLHGVPLKNLSYLFMYKRLFTVDMEVDGREAFDTLAAEFAKRHGKPVKASGGMLSYLGKEVDIMFYFDTRRKVGEISYVFKNLPCPVE